MTGKRVGKLQLAHRIAGDAEDFRFIIAGEGRAPERRDAMSSRDRLSDQRAAGFARRSEHEESHPSAPGRLSRAIARSFINRVPSRGLRTEAIVKRHRRHFSTHSHVEKLDSERERHREVNVSLADVLTHPVGHQHHSDQQEEAERQHLHARVPVDECRDASRERQHDPDRDNHRDHHHGNVLRHPDRRNHGVEREHDIEGENLDEDDSERSTAGRSFSLLVHDLEILVNLACRFRDEKETATQQDEIASGESLAEDREQGIGEAHDPGDREQQSKPENERQRKPESSRRRLPAGRQLVGQDRNEDHVVDAEYDLHRGQRYQAEPGRGLGKQFHVQSSWACVAMLHCYRLDGIRRRVLPVEPLELREQRGMLFPERARPLEECLGDHREELRRIRRAVLVEQRRQPRVRCIAQRIELGAHHPPPGAIIAACLERGRTVAALTLEIELVREFVEHEILAVGRVGRAATNRVPRQHQRREPLSGVAEAVLAALFPDAAADVALLVRGVSRRIDDDGNQLRVVIRLAMQQQQARLPRDGDADLVGQLEPADSLEVLLRQKYLGVSEQLGLIVRREAGEDREIALEDRAPGGRNRLGAQAGAAAGFEQVEYHR